MGDEEGQEEPQPISLAHFQGSRISLRIPTSSPSQMGLCCNSGISVIETQLLPLCRPDFILRLPTDGKMAVASPHVYSGSSLAWKVKQPPLEQSYGMV